MNLSYTVVVQAYDSDGIKALQRDSLPVCNQEPTTIWSPGDVVVDDHPLVLADVSAGDYPLYVGLYDAATGVRLPPLDAAGNPVDDKFQLTTISVPAR